MQDQERTGNEVAPAMAPAAGRGALRVSHEDRDQVAEALRGAAGDGRLTADELDERLEKALTARTYDDLAVLLTDLPAGGTALAPLAGHLAAVMAGGVAAGGVAAGGVAAGGVAAAAPKELMKIHVSSGQSKRVGRWTVPARMDLEVGSGQVLVDFTQAVITQPTLHIDAEVRSGQIILVTKPGIAVDLDDVSVRSGSVKVRAPWGDRVPAFLRITVAGTCGSGRIVTRPRRRSFWQWLRRAPMSYEIAA